MNSELGFLSCNSDCFSRFDLSKSSDIFNTNPFQLWVGPGSRAAEEKLFFDSHLAPFYRIEQVLYCVPYTGPYFLSRELLATL